MAKFELTDNQSNAVNELDNVVVSAGAGSGKTRVLALRFANLVENENIQADRILTLTFMNKAAVEMKGRIFKQLSEDSCDESIPETTIEKAKEALKIFDKAHIQTLDSYFSEVVRSGAHFYGISPSFSIDDEKIESLIKIKALQFILARNQNKAIQKLTISYKFSQIAENIFADAVLEHSSIVSKAGFVDSLSKQKSEIETQWQKCADSIDSAIISLSKLTLQGTTAGVVAINSTLQIPKVENPLSTGVLKKSFWETIESSFSEISEKIENYLLYLGKWSELSVRSSAAVNDAMPYLNEIYENLNKLIYVAEFILNFDTNLEIMKLLDEFTNEVQKEKRTSGILTFKDVSELALDILKNHDDIRHLEQQRFDKIMIDEFQDNNALQCDALFMLSDENEKFEETSTGEKKYIVPNFDESSENYIQKRLGQKLFFVGDEKQSIYRFRGADVSVFRNLQKHLRSKKFNEGTPDEKNFIYLESNFRSQPNLVSSFNSIFGGNNIKDEKSVFMKSCDEEKIPEYEAEYLKVECDPKKEDGDKNRVHIAMFKKTSDTVKEAKDSSYSFEASYVAKKIKELVKQGRKYSDIAILFRASSQLEEYESEFLKAHIPYSTEVYKGFFSDGPINDIVSFLKICVYPKDFNSYSKLLCSPFVNLTREQMESFVARVNSDFTIYPFDETSVEIAKNLFGESSVAFHNYCEAKIKFDEIKNLLHKEKISKIVSKLWYDFGYRYETLWNNDVQMFSNLYDILFELARKSEANTQSIAGFLDSIEEYNDSASKIEGLDIPFETADAVKILTIHKSKGLEFPVVFVCSAGYKFPNYDSPVKFSKNFGAILKTPSSQIFGKVKTKSAFDYSFDLKRVKSVNYFLEAESELEAPEDSAELRRLTYVAFTRAIDELFVVGSYDQFYKGDLKDERVPVLPKTIFQSIENVINRYTVTKDVPVLDENGNQLLDDKGNPIVNVSRTQTNDSTFDFEEFSNKFSYDESEVDSDKSEILNDFSKSEKAKLIEELSEIYDSTSEIEKDYIVPIHISPSTIEFRAVSQDDSPVPMSEIDEIVDSSIPNKEKVIEWYENWNKEHPENQKTVKIPRPRFGYNDFGSIAHAYMEEKINSIIEKREFKPEIPEKLWLGLDVESKQKNSEEMLSENRKRIEEICAGMAEDFSKTDLFTEIVASEWKKTEYAFRTSLKDEINIKNNYNVIVSGMMDLVYKNPDSTSRYKYTIVDYKTDKLQLSERYFAQLASYRLAVSQMKGVAFEDVRCVLYFLRYGEKAQVDITEKCTLDILGIAVNSFLKKDVAKFEANKSAPNPYDSSLHTEEDEGIDYSEIENENGEYELGDENGEE